MSIDIPPNQTIYVSNLYEKLKKEELKKALYAVFSQYGKILDVVVMKNFRLRGQAWVVFADITAATNALRLSQGFPFYEKPMKIAYAKTKSDVIARADGSYVPRDKAQSMKENATKRDALVKRGEDRRDGKMGAAPMAGMATTSSDHAEPPHHILFAENLPPATSESMIKMLFEQFPGFKEVRLIEARPGIAFVEFTNEMESSVALNGLQGFQITQDHAMKLSYAKK
jgi:U2 small nuclear ribonucleoprotein B''